MSKSAERKSPSQSATLYKVGTKKTGNDGNKWVIVENKSGTNRWQLYKKVNTKSKTVIKKVKKVKTESKTKKSKSKSIRKAPSSSATLHKVGSKKVGNDGNTWVIKESKNGTKSWKLHKKVNTKTKSTSKGTLKKFKKTKSKTKSKSKKPKRKSKAGKFSVLDFYDVKQMTLTQLEKVINNKTKTKNIYNKIKTKLIPALQDAVTNVCVVPLPFSDGGVFWSDYPLDYARDKCKQDDLDNFATVVFYLDNKGNEIVTQNGIKISYSHLSIDGKKKIINVLNKELDGYYDWNGKNTDVIIINFDEGLYKQIDIKKLKQDDIYPSIQINIYMVKSKTNDDAPELYNELYDKMKKQFKNSSIDGGYSYSDIDLVVYTVDPKTYTKHVTELKKLIKNNKKVNKFSIVYYSDRSSKGVKL